jgi:hypothetical protein
VRSWLVVVGVAAALLAAMGVYFIVGARLAPPPGPLAAAPAATPAPAPAPAAPPAATGPAAAPAQAPEPAAAAPAAPAAPARERRAPVDRRSRELARVFAAERAAVLAASAPPAAAAAAPAPSPAAAPSSADPDRALAAELTGGISGRLLDERGLPLAGTSILALATDGGDGQETVSDDDGAFLVAGLRPGRYVVFPALGSALGSRLGARGVDVGAAQVTRVDVREQLRGGTVRVTALHEDGRPAACEAILVSGRPGAGGSFGPLLGHDVIWLPGLGADRTVLQKVPPGTYTLVLLLDGARTAARAALDPVVVSDGEVAVNVRLGRDVPQG